MMSIGPVTRLRSQHRDAALDMGDATHPAGRIGVGDFQIAPAINPATNRPSNTVYYGTFWGKLTDTDESGRLVTNKRDVHCDSSGKLDYHGDGAHAPDPIRPTDW